MARVLLRVRSEPGRRPLRAVGGGPITRSSPTGRYAQDRTRLRGRSGSMHTRVLLNAAAGILAAVLTATPALAHHGWRAIRRRSRSPARWSAPSAWLVPTPRCRCATTRGGWGTSHWRLPRAEARHAGELRGRVRLARKGGHHRPGTLRSTSCGRYALRHQRRQRHEARSSPRLVQQRVPVRVQDVVVDLAQGNRAREGEGRADESQPAAVRRPTPSLRGCIESDRPCCALGSSSSGHREPG